MQNNYIIYHFRDTGSLLASSIHPKLSNAIISVPAPRLSSISRTVASIRDRPQSSPGWVSMHWWINREIPSQRSSGYGSYQVLSIVPW